MAQLCLLYLMKTEFSDISTLEWERFKAMMIASHPERASEILKALDTKVEDDKRPEPVITEDGFEGDEQAYMLAELRRLGFAIQED